MAISFDLQLDLSLSAGTISRAREAIAAAQGNRLPEPQLIPRSELSLSSVNAYNLGSLEAHCEILADQLERAHAALAGVA